MLTIQSRQYALPDGQPLSVTFFRDLTHFRHTVNDHFLQPLEPWERLLGVKFLKKVRQKIKAENVSVLEELYLQVVPKLDEGIRFSIELPIYAEFQQERCRVGEDRWYKTAGYFFLSDQGFLMVVRDGLLRTARFQKQISGSNPSKRELFLAARSFVKQCLAKGYVDSKGNENVTQVSYRLITPENWSRRSVI